MADKAIPPNEVEQAIAEAMREYEVAEETRVLCGPNLINRIYDKLLERGFLKEGVGVNPQSRCDTEPKIIEEVFDLKDDTDRHPKGCGTVYMDFEDVLEELEKSEEELKKIVEEGGLHAFRDENHLKFRKDDVESAKAVRSQKPGQPDSDPKKTC